MKLPTIPTLNTTRQIQEVFGGYNHNLAISEGEFYDMKNMTSDHYPILAPRGKRGVYAAPGSAQAMIAKDSLCYVDGSQFVMNGYPVEMGLSTAEEDCPKQLISMGAYVIIMPDRMYINTMDLTDFGHIDAEFTTTEDVTFSLCTVDGAAYENVTVSDTAPEEPENLALWIDTSAEPHALKQYSSYSEMWVSVATTYVKIASPGIGVNFEVYDGVTISGVLHEQLQDLNGSLVIWAKGDDYIVVVGLLDEVVTQSNADGSIRIQRKMPEMDYVTEYENRLWGCRYGLNSEGKVVNELYASKLGDFKNWNCFLGISTDSYAASCGSDGPFTGVISMPGYVLFFKENCIHKVYGNYPANFQIQTTACRGVQRGCERSLAMVNEIVYYKARHAVCAYDGSLPVEISTALGSERYGDAVAGSHGNKYYISMADDSGKYHLFVYDTAKGMWHKEDHLHAKCFCSCREELYCIDEDSGKIITMLGSGTEDSGKVAWMAQSGILGADLPDRKYISRLNVRLSLEVGSTVRFSVQYDSFGGWEHLGTVKGSRLDSFAVPILPRRCDHFRLRIEGTGAAKIHSITKTICQGSDIP